MKIQDLFGPLKMGQIIDSHNGDAEPQGMRDRGTSTPTVGKTGTMAILQAPEQATLSPRYCTPWGAPP